MLELILLASAVSFLTSLSVLPVFIRFLESVGIVGTDIQKADRPRVAEMGGPVVMAGFLAGIFLFIWLNIFVFAQRIDVLGIFGGISTILIIMIIGMIDDMSALSKVREGGRGFERYKRLGLKQWQKPLLTLPAAIPLMAIMAGDSSMAIPFVGTVNLGILYPLFVVPLGVVGASNAINMLAGFNGLEAGLGFVTLASLGIFGYINGEIAAAAIAAVMASAILAFLVFNWYPAKIMPGDSFVYALGATIAVVAIIGNMEKFALYVFAPWMLEFLLKLGSGFKAENFGSLGKDGTLKTKYPKPYSITHLVMRAGRFKEWQVSAIIIAAEVVVCLLAFAISGVVLF